MAVSQYPNINENQFAGLLQVATAAADAQERHASALGKRRRDDETFIDHQLRTPASDLTQDDHGNTPTLQSSAAVLFREPSEKSKKYSRPPLGKVYTDLELAPEMFLQLQSAAKDFMLDPNHTERKGVVGQKKQNGNNDVAKLKLWNCVEEFLHTSNDKTGEVNCEYFFGHNAGAGIPNQPVRTFFWPEDRDQVIKMCMPLFRKMVTNERQRVYASETRKQDPRKADASADDSNIRKGSSSDLVSPAATDAILSPSAHYRPEAAIKSNLSTNQDQSNLFLSQSQNSTTPQQVVLHVNIVAKEGDTPGRRVTPRISIPSTLASTPFALLEEVRKRHDLSKHESDEADTATPPIKAWLEQGLVPIRDENEWMVALFSAETVDWMDGELRVLIEV